MPTCTHSLIKNGKYISGKQKYKCTKCGKHRVLHYQYTAYKQDTNSFIINHLKEGCGIRSIARLAKISTSTVVRRIKQLAQSIKQPHIKLGKTYELDEMRTYVGNKDNIYWVIYAIDKQTKEVVMLRVGKRNKTTVKKVTDVLLLSNPQAIHTDKLGLYKTLIPKEIHKTKKGGINHIERKNLTLRTHIKRLSRRTICFSKSAIMLKNSVELYLWGSSIAKQAQFA
jgi:IS1 family transposase